MPGSYPFSGCNRYTAHDGWHVFLALHGAALVASGEDRYMNTIALDLEVFCFLFHVQSRVSQNESPLNVHRRGLTART